MSILPDGTTIYRGYTLTAYLSGRPNCHVNKLICLGAPNAQIRLLKGKRLRISNHRQGTDTLPTMEMEHTKARKCSGHIETRTEAVRTSTTRRQAYIIKYVGEQTEIRVKYCYCFTHDITLCQDAGRI